MPKVPQTRHELLEQLLENLNWLRSAATTFDAGDLSQAKLLAIYVRTLMRDGEGRSRSKSLVTQLGFGPNMVMISTARHFDVRNIMGNEARLCIVQISDARASWRAHCQSQGDNHSKQLFFRQWWSEQVVNAPGVSMTRREIVGLLADNLGGVHSDPEIQATHAHLIRNNPIAIDVQINGAERVRLSRVELFSMRQIAHEALISIERKLAKG